MGQLPKGRVLGVDAGTVRTGLALSDTDGFLASVLCTVKANGIRALAAEIKNKAEEHNVRLIVIGHPINMNGTIGVRAQHCEEFAKQLEIALGNIPVVLWDERSTTVSAIGFLNATDTRGKKRKAVIDTVAATIILENYLNYRKNHREE